MEIVVRTPHGEADVSVGDHGPDATVSTLIAAVTGQAAPMVAIVDGRVVDGATTIDAAILHRGSIIDTTDGSSDHEREATVELVQLTGHGTARRLGLTAGRYRIGPGRRAHADELSLGTVEEARAEITVDVDGRVTAESPDPRSRDGGETGELLEIGGRWFLARPPVLDAEVPIGAPGSDGTVPVVRTAIPPGETLPMLAAFGRATRADPGLWTLRWWDGSAGRVPAGLDAEGRVVHVDLAGPALGISGDERFRYAAARAVLLEAATLHGPADVDIVIATSPAYRSLWDWVKWLPHATDARVDIQDRARADALILSSGADIARWAAAQRDSSDDRHTLLVLDTTALWSEPGPELRAILRALTHPAAEGRPMHALVLIDHGEPIPAFCTSTIDQLDDGTARVARPTQPDVVASISLVEESVALDVARALARFGDPELDRPPPAAPARSIELDRLLAISGVDDIVDGWETQQHELPPVVIGRRNGTDLEIRAESGHPLTIIGADRRAADDVAVSIVAGLATRVSPRSLRVLVLSDVTPSRLDVLHQLPHAVDRAADGQQLGSVDPDRLVARLLAVLSEPSLPRQHVMLVAAGERADSVVAALERMAAEPEQTVGDLHLVIVDPPQSAATGVRSGPSITVEDTGRGRRAVLRSGTDTDSTEIEEIDADLADTSVEFEPWIPAIEPPAIDEVIVRPRVISRPLTPIERRLTVRSRQTDAATPTDLARILAWCTEASDREGVVAPAALVPAPFPEQVDLADLLDEWPGDAIPIGLVDRPEADGPAPLWWQPGDGTIVALGTPRSGVAALADAVVVGLAARVGHDDVEVFAACRSAARRHAAASLVHAVQVVDSDRVVDVRALMDAIDERLAASDPPPGAGIPHRPARRLVLLLDDVAHTRRRLAMEPDEEDLAARLDGLLTRVAASSDADLVAVIHDIADAGAIGACAPGPGVQVLSAATAASPDRPPPARGNVVLQPGGQIVQLIDEIRAIDTVVAERTEQEPER